MASALRPATAARRALLTMRPLGLATRSSHSAAPSPPQQPDELGVGELQGIKFRVAPLRRTGEDDDTKRARLLCAFFLQYCVCNPLPPSLSLSP